MAGTLKKILKKYSHSAVFKALAGFGRALDRFYENRNHDIFTNGELELIRKLSKLGLKTIIDGGANEGNYSSLLLEFFQDATIYAFEPVPETFNRLNERFLNEERLQARKLALCEKPGQRKMYLYPSHTHSSLYDIKGLPYKTSEQIEINCVRGDDFLEEENLEQVDFLKLDLEGAEYQALKGFRKALENRKIRLVQFEYGYINITTKNLLIDYYQFFESMDYQVGKIFPGYVEFRPYHFKYENFYGSNYVALHRQDTELYNLLTSSK